MYIGRSYRLREFLFWTRRRIYILTLTGTFSVALYRLCGLQWLGISWTVVALLGTATAFILGFRNTQTYNRTLEAHHIWREIISASRSWGIISRDYTGDARETERLIKNHLVWLTLLRYEMRRPRGWENIGRRRNREYRRHYTIPEQEARLASELRRYLSPEQLNELNQRENRMAFVLGQQSLLITEAFAQGRMVVLQYVDMQRKLAELTALQSRSEHIKNTPYPRQYAIISNLLIRLFCLLLPFGMLKEFDRLNATVSGMMHGHMVWLVVPFSVLVSWLYTSLEQVGESTENPFEGSPNDVPVSHICRGIERDLMELTGGEKPPEYTRAGHDIIM